MKFVAGLDEGGIKSHELFGSDFLAGGGAGQIPGWGMLPYAALCCFTRPIAANPRLEIRESGFPNTDTLSGRNPRDPVSF
jgi:hypothetical protein